MKTSWFVFLLLMAEAGYSTPRSDLFERLDSLGSNWSPARVEVALGGGASADGVTVGDHIVYDIRANTPGYATLLHVDSHGKLTAMFSNAAKRIEPEESALLPTGVQLRQTPPLGRDTVYVLLTDQPIDSTFMGADKPTPFYQPEQGIASVDLLRKKIGSLGKGIKLTSARLQYYVNGEPGTTQYTTRGLTLELTTSPRDESNTTVEKIYPDNIQFEFDSDRLTDRGRQQLDIWGELLSDKKIQHQVTLVGHTDDQGGESYNYDLSMRRAMAAKRYIVNSFGIGDARLEIVAKGKSQPLVPNSDEQARTQNRRVEFVFQQN